MSLRGTVSIDLQQQLHRQVKSLTVEKLKKVLRHAGLTVTGNKAILVDRIIAELNHRSQTHNMDHFTRLRQLIQNPDSPPPIQATPGFGTFSTSNFTSSQNNGPLNGQYPVLSSRSELNASTGLQFKASPFYNVVEPISHRRQMDTRPETRGVMEFTFRIKADTLERLRRDASMKVLVYCGTDDSLRAPADITFPANFELKINGTEVRANFKGLKNKAGTTRPVEITALLSQSASQDNQIWLCWAVTSRKYHLAFYLVRQRGAMDLVQRLKEAKRISKGSVINEMQRRASDSDLVATSSRMSLKCPLSTMRIETPCRSQICKHNQCFDALSFLQLQEQAPQWNCPVCNRSVPFDILQVDDYVDDILRSTPRSAEQVAIEPQGSWSLVQDNDEKGEGIARTFKKEETDSGDDLEIVDGPSLGVSAASLSTLTSMHRSPGQTTPNQRARTLATTGASAGKRPVSEVIDLTEETDNEDSMPAPHPKRQMTVSSIGRDWGHASYKSAVPMIGESNRYSFAMPSKASQPPTGSSLGP